MKTEATLPIQSFIKPGAQYHEPLAHYDGAPLANIMVDADGHLLFGMAVHLVGWEWPLCLTPISKEDQAKLEGPDGELLNGAVAVFQEIMCRADGYYLWEVMGNAPRTEFVAGPVPADWIPR